VSETPRPPSRSLPSDHHNPVRIATEVHDDPVNLGFRNEPFCEGRRGRGYGVGGRTRTGPRPETVSTQIAFTKGHGQALARAGCFQARRSCGPHCPFVTASLTAPRLWATNVRRLACRERGTLRCALGPGPTSIIMRLNPPNHHDQQGADRSARSEQDPARRAHHDIHRLRRPVDYWPRPHVLPRAAPCPSPSRASTMSSRRLRNLAVARQRITDL